MSRMSNEKGPSRPVSASQSEVDLAEVVTNQGLATAVYHSIGTALQSNSVHVVADTSVSKVFNRSLRSAIRNIEEHPKGQLIQRFVQYGTVDPDDPIFLDSDGSTILSDPECGMCVDFIHSHMINRFKGELAELLALDPCIRLMERLIKQGRLPADVHLYWGDQVQERRRAATNHQDNSIIWGGFAKGADGLLVSREQPNSVHSKEARRVQGIIEVKSMYRSVKRVLDQIERHRTRLAGGVRLGSDTWLPNQVQVAESSNTSKTENGLLRIIVAPSRWRLGRRWRSERANERTRAISMEEVPNPPLENQTQQSGQNDWRITLAWSEESLTQAAYDMTVWYLSEVGSHVYAREPLPSEASHMTPEKAGLNQVKYWLYIIGLRPISKRQTQRANRLYNAYAFGSPLALDSTSEMLWPSDFPHS